MYSHATFLVLACNSQNQALKLTLYLQYLFNTFALVHDRDLFCRHTYNLQKKKKEKKRNEPISYTAYF